MPTTTTHQHIFPNGLTLLGEQIDHVRSATLYALIPAGFVHEPEDQLGISGVLAEMLPRGAGNRNSRDFAQALDFLGVDRNESAGSFNINVSAGTLARNIPPLLELIRDLLLQPHLPADELEPARDLAFHDLAGLEDSPSELVLLELKRRYYPQPLNRNGYGTADGLNNLTPEKVRAYYAARFQPRQTILSIAGKIDFAEVVDHVGQLFGDWQGTAPAPVIATRQPGSSCHLPKETQQTQIAIAFPSAPFASPDFYAARGAIGVLSGGMSARLFTEVREKRGLCYSVSASYDSMKTEAAVLCYAGTSADRAQQTLDVTVSELKRLREGVTDDEVLRVKASLKTALIMQQESTSARAASMASDWFHLGRLRTLDEIQIAVDALTPRSILEYLEKYPVRDLTVVTLGPKPLAIPE